MYCLVLLSALLACAAGVPLINPKPMIDGRIFGGTETDITSHPYQVSVLIREFYFCGGSIISPNWVVTLAFCVYVGNPTDFTVISGSTYSTFGGTLHNVTNIIMHDNFTEFNWDYDVALMKVSPAFTYSDSVQPIALECDPVPVGTEAVVTGWGATSTGSPNSDTLLQATIQITNDSECNKFYAIYGGITDSRICAVDRSGTKGACWGDYGSSLVASNRLVGIYSFGDGCQIRGYPDIYTKMSGVCDWIVTNSRE